MCGLKTGVIDRWSEDHDHMGVGLGFFHLEISASPDITFNLDNVVVVVVAFVIARTKIFLTIPGMPFVMEHLQTILMISYVQNIHFVRMVDCVRDAT